MSFWLPDTNDWALASAHKLSTDQTVYIDWPFSHSFTRLSVENINVFDFWLLVIQ